MVPVPTASVYRIRGSAPTSRASFSSGSRRRSPRTVTVNVAVVAPAGTVVQASIGSKSGPTVAVTGSAAAHTSASYDNGRDSVTGNVSGRVPASPSATDAS